MSLTSQTSRTSQTSQASRTNRHSPLPWHVGLDSAGDVVSAYGRVAECGPAGSARARADAAFIVLAVGCHYGLVEALEAVCTCLGRGESFPELSECKVALDRARGELDKARGQA